jgi:hypothetical protein
MAEGAWLSEAEEAKPTNRSRDQWRVESVAGPLCIACRDDTTTSTTTRLTARCVLSLILRFIRPYDRRDFGRDMRDIAPFGAAPGRWSGRIM